MKINPHGLVTGARAALPRLKEWIYRYMEIVMIWGTVYLDNSQVEHRGEIR